MTKPELHDKAKSLPLLPGVYIIRNKKDEIIYIGKAKRLRTRVSQYFRHGVPHDEKTTRMIAAAFSFDIIVTRTEVEALTLECSQIKMHRPKYNILLKDDRGYSYIKITKGPWPRLSAEYHKENDGAEYIGPYMSSFAVRQMVQTVHDAFLLPRCTRRFPQDLGKGRPCLYMHIGQCRGYCSGKISEAVYTGAVNDAVTMLKSGKSEMIALLRQRMEQASELLEYERAAVIRNQITAIERASARQTVVTKGEKEQDVIALAKSGNTVCVAVLRLREGRLMDKQEYVFYNQGDVDAVREEFVPRYYIDDKGIVPRVIAVDAAIADSDVLEEALSQKRGIKVRIYVPERGDNAALVKMAYINAVERLARETGRTKQEEKILDELAMLMGLPAAPEVIESFDISNWGDGTSVCGMVVFENGKPKKAGYRRFKIRTVERTDDYGSMAEVLGRRVNAYNEQADAQFMRKPDLILLDGGKGQVSVVRQVLEGTSFADVPLFGMVKDARHRTRGLVDSTGAEIVLSLHKSVFSFVSSVQDEVHRFSIDYQRRAAKGKMFSSTLTTISGVGPATGKALLANFKTIRKIGEASAEELAAVKGVNKTAAAAVWEHFHSSQATESSKQEQ